MTSDSSFPTCLASVFQLWEVWKFAAIFIDLSPSSHQHCPRSWHCLSKRYHCFYVSFQDFPFPPTSWPWLAIPLRSYLPECWQAVANSPVGPCLCTSRPLKAPLSTIHSFLSKHEPCRISFQVLLSRYLVMTSLLIHAVSLALLLLLLLLLFRISCT